MLAIKQAFGKNSVLRSLDFQEGATARQRNTQIGGHKAWQTRTKTSSTSPITQPPSTLGCRGGTEPPNSRPSPRSQGGHHRLRPLRIKLLRATLSLRLRPEATRQHPCNNSCRLPLPNSTPIALFSRSRHLFLLSTGLSCKLLTLFSKRIEIFCWWNILPEYGASYIEEKQIIQN